MRRQPSTVALLLRSVEGTRISDSFGSGSPEPFMFVLTDSIHGGLLSTFRGKEVCRFAQTKRTSLLRSSCSIFLCDAEPSTASIQLQPVEGLRFIGCFATRTPFDSFSLTLNLSGCTATFRVIVLGRWGKKRYTVLLYGVSQTVEEPNFASSKNRVLLRFS